MEGEEEDPYDQEDDMDDREQEEEDDDLADENDMEMLHGAKKAPIGPHDAEMDLREGLDSRRIRGALPEHSD